MRNTTLSSMTMRGNKSTVEKIIVPPSLQGASVLGLRSYQRLIFEDRSSGIVVLHWARQIGKSFTLAAWAVDRLLSRPGRLVTVLSNSRENGAEFLQKCDEVCVLMDKLLRARNAEVELTDASPHPDFASMRLELRITMNDDDVRSLGRIKVLAANPRTARGFSGDLILDEFAFHENSAAIWEAAEPILASNADFLCRIASTGNGKHNMFYRMAAPGVSDEAVGGSWQKKWPPSAGGFPLSRIRRSQAHAQGVKIFDPLTRKPITPEEARARALDKRAYDQNYECIFADENLTLLSHELINNAERDGIGILCEQDWGAAALEHLQSCNGPLYVGFDVARTVDLSVITVIEKLGEIYFVRALLRIQNMRLPEQQERLGEVCRMPTFHRAAIDMTGLGLGLVEYAQKEFGASRIHGINFASSVPVTQAILREGRQRETVRVTEALAIELLRVYEDRRIQQPIDSRLRDDLRKPERVITAGGRVSIAATRDKAGHADHFWSLALALEAAAVSGGSFACESLKVRQTRTCLF